MTAVHGGEDSLVWIPGGGFRMGSDRHYPDEAPAHWTNVQGFWMQPTTVTNAQFSRFVAETGYVTLAERRPDPADFPGVDAGLLQPGALVFNAVPRGHMGHGWSFVPGAQWRHPLGPGSSIEGLDMHPVVQVACDDAEAFARWAGLALPTEAQWEFAARGGLEGADFVWGADFTPGGRAMANTWQGEFPYENLALDGYERTAPGRAFEPNGFGLYQMAGNVWEWTSDWYRSGAQRTAPAPSCCSARAESIDPLEGGPAIARRVVKGGSYLCAPNHCQRYRPAARQPQAIDTAMCHLGFRCILPVA